jgi:hypothetical protein
MQMASWQSMFLLVLKRAGLAVFLFVATYSVVEQLVFKFLADTGDRYIIPLQALSIILGVLYSVILFLVMGWAIKASSQEESSGLVSHFQEFGSHMFGEFFRVIGRTAIFTLLAIVPGVVVLVQLWFVPWIVQFHVAYQNDEIDALEGSRGLVKGHFWLVLFWVLLYFMLTISLEFAKAYFSIFSFPLVFSLLVVIAFLLETAFLLKFFSIYEGLTRAVAEERP